MKYIFALLLIYGTAFCEEHATLPERVHVLHLIIYIDINGNPAKVCEMLEMDLDKYIKRNHAPTPEEIKQYSKVGYIVEIINQTLT